MRVERRHLGHPLLEQQVGRADLGDGQEPPLHRPIAKHGKHSEERHPLVVDHEGLDHGVPLLVPDPRRRIINGLVESEPASKPGLLHGPQVRYRLGREDHQGERRGVRRDHQVFAEPALEPEPRDTERPVLVIHVRIDQVVP